MTIRAALFACSMLAAQTAADAQELPYLDNRTDSVALVRSLYNAINRKEYARAWSYYGDEKPSKSLEDFRRMAITTPSESTCGSAV